MYNKKYVKVTFFIFVLILFNLSYLNNSGLLIWGLKRAKVINSLNIKTNLAAADSKSSKSLSNFRMDYFLSPEESESIALKIKSLSKQWKKRNAAMSTLGTASYLDGENLQNYVKDSKKSNPFMNHHFKELHSAVLNYFQRLCPKSKVRYRKNAALPGFHIFDCNKLFSLPVASVHKDLQWKRITLEDGEEIDMENTMSFTLALELPPGGGGLYIFDTLELGLANFLIPGMIRHSMANKKKIEYEVGYMVVHNGMHYHMIAPCKPSSKFSRITLQGHGVYEKTKNTWWLYW